MRIGELAQRSGVAVETIRYYEAQGCCPRRCAWTTTTAITHANIWQDFTLFAIVGCLT